MMISQKYNEVTAQQCVIQINCECEIQLFDLTTVILNRQQDQVKASSVTANHGQIYKN